MSHKIQVLSIGVLLLLSACSQAEVSLPNESFSSVQSEVIKIPSTYKLDVPFTPQAPRANWDDPYQEACEEASIIMVDQFYKNQSLDPEISDALINDLVGWQFRNGYTEDVTITELATIAEEYYGYKSIISEDVSVDSVKKYIAQGMPVIVPAAGRELGNPYFSGEGPWYHMLVITGYDRDEFITNDPGTRRGEGYKYKYDVLLNAIHDWTGIKEQTSSGAQRILILERL